MTVNQATLQAQALEMRMEALELHVLQLSIQMKAGWVLGSQDAAHRWLLHPASALDGRLPVNMLGTLEEAKEVDQLLGRLEYGIYT